MITGTICFKREIAIHDSIIRAGSSDFNYLPIASSTLFSSKMKWVIWAILSILSLICSFLSMRQIGKMSHMTHISAVLKRDEEAIWALRPLA